MKKKLLSIFLLSAVFVSFCLPGLRAAAETGTPDLDSKIQEAEEAKEAAKKRVKELKDEIAELEGSKGDLLEYVKKVDKKIEKVTKTLSDLNKQVNAARESLGTLEDELAAAENLQKEQYETMKKRIKYMYENGSGDYMDVLFSAESLSDLMNRSEYIEKISEYDAGLFEQYVKTKQEAEMRRIRMEEKIEEIATLQEEAEADKDALKELKENKKSEVSKLNSAISFRDSKVQTFSEQVAKQEQEVENLLLEKQRIIEQQEAARQAAAQKAAQAGAAQGNPVQPGADSYANTGQLRWPLQVAGRISSRFGKRTSPTQGASTYHRGIDIAVESGTPIVAAADGTVVTATYSASAGNYIMLYHGNSLYTVYMHASSLAVREGAEVKQGDVIAYVGSSGVSTGAHLHFGVSVNGNYVDPLNYVGQ